MALAWTPETIEALGAAVRDGVLVEGHHVDFKRELTVSTAGNKGLAKDLAAFSGDGGQVIFGVDENDNGTLAVRPVVLTGLKERVDQIARSAVSPPLTVRCVELPTAEDPSQGCLIIVVPASLAGPHQAAERFWGRADTTNYVLPPSEVAAIYERRARRRADIEALLTAEIARDPTPEHLRELGHLFLVAQPEAGDDELLFRSLPGKNFSTWVHQNLLPNLTATRWSPDIHECHCCRRAGGWALHTYCIGEERAVRPNGELPANENHLLDIEINEDGGVRLFCARATDGGDKFMDTVVAGLILRAVETARAIAETSAFFGAWQIGIALTNIRGAVSYELSRNIMANPTRFSEDAYRRVSHTTYDELAIDVVAVATRLAAPLLRGFQSPFDPRSLRPC